MNSNYDWLKPQKKAPLYRSDCRPFIRLGRQLCLSFAEAAAHNFNQIKDQGMIVIPDEKDPRFAEKAWAAMRGKFTSELLGAVSPDKLYYFNPIELLIVTADGDLLLMQRSHRGSSEGMLNHFAGGFPHVVFGKDGFEIAEPKKETALRETKEELGVKIYSAVDLNCMTYDNTISPFRLAKNDGGEYPGFTPEIMQRFGFYWPTSTVEVLRSLKTGPDSIGMAIIRLKDLEGMLRGDETMSLHFVPNSLDFAKPFINDAMHNGSLHLSDIRQALLQSTMSPEERKQKDGKFDPEKMVQAVAGRDVFYEPNYFSGLAAFRAAGFALSSFASSRLDDFKFQSRQKILKPHFDPLPAQPRNLILAA